MNRQFELLSLSDPFNVADCDAAFPSAARNWNNASVLLESSATHFGYVFDGDATIEFEGRPFNLTQGMYFCVPGAGRLTGTGSGIIASRYGIMGLFCIGGPVEERGRLKYIDGCSDSLLLQPVLKGYPCLNFLHIPPGVDQTPHTHPSVRIGVILSGAGYCLTTDDEFDLLPGKVFILRTNHIHSFHTDKENLRLVIYHPDSDFGPDNDDHPMLNRTIIEGVSASSTRKAGGAI